MIHPLKFSVLNNINENNNFRWQNVLRSYILSLCTFHISMLVGGNLEFSLYECSKSTKGNVYLIAFNIS